MEKAFSKRLLYYYLILLSLLSLVFGIWASKVEYATFFTYHDLMVSKSLIEDSIFDLPGLAPSYNRGFISLLAVIHLICGIQFKDIIFIPVGIILVPPIFYILVRVLFGDNILGAIVVAYIFSDIIQTAWHNVFPYAFSRSIFLILILLLHFMIVKKTESSNYILLFTILFAGLVFMHYTTSLWIIIYSTSLVFLHKIKGKEEGARKLLNMIIISLIIYLSVSKIFYEVFIPELFSRDFFNTLEVFKNKFYSTIFSTKTDDEFIYYPVKGTYSLIRTLLNFCILAGILITFLPFVKVARSKSYNPSSEIDIEPYFYHYGAIIFLAIFHAFGYGIAIGSLSHQVILFLGPLAILSGIRFVKSTRIKHVLESILTIILLLSLLSLVYYIPHIEKGETYASPLRYSDVKPSTDWFFRHIKENTTTALLSLPYIYYADFINVYQGFNKTIYPHYFSIEDYKNIIKLGRLKERYIIIDKCSYKHFIISERFNLYKPVETFIDKFNTNNYLDKIYDSNNILLIFVNVE